MSETRQIRALVIVTLVAGVLGLAAVWYAPSLLRDDDAYVASLTDGKAALLVADDSLEGTTVSLVIIDVSGRVICKEATTIGGDK